MIDSIARTLPLWLRLVVGLTGLLVAPIWVYFDTHDLDGVKQRSLYRTAFFLFLRRGWITLWFVVIDSARGL